jgi:hypothetical protein
LPERLAPARHPHGMDAKAHDKIEYQLNLNFTKFIEMIVFWDIAPCNLVDVNFKDKLKIKNLTV